MIVYIFVFALSLMGVKIADMWYDDQQRFWGGSLLAILPPILIAGLRDSTVGSDMDLYIVPIFNGIASNGQNLAEFIDSYPDIEFGYLLLNYVVAQMTDLPFVLLTCIHILIIIPLYVTAIKWRDYLSPIFFMFIFYMIFFQESLSIVRQSIALSFSMLGLTMFLEPQILASRWWQAAKPRPQNDTEEMIDTNLSKYVCSGLCLVIAFLFHQTAIIALSFPIIYFVVDRFSLKQTYVLYIVIALLIVVFFLNFDSLLIWLIENEYIDFKFLKYTSADNTFIPVLGTTNIVIKVLTIAYLVYIMIIYEADSLLKFFLVVAVMDMLFSLCALIMQPLDRISLYFRLVSCISLPYLIYNYPIIFTDEDAPYTTPIEGFVCVLLFAYWFYVYMLGNYDDTADYQISSTLFV